MAIDWEAFYANGGYSNENSGHNRTTMVLTITMRIIMTFTKNKYGKGRICI